MKKKHTIPNLNIKSDQIKINNKFIIHIHDAERVRHRLHKAFSTITLYEIAGLFYIINVPLIVCQYPLNSII